MRKADVIDGPHTVSSLGVGCGMMMGATNHSAFYQISNNLSSKSEKSIYNKAAQERAFIELICTTKAIATYFLQFPEILQDIL